MLAILLYFKESRKAEEKVTERREKIEGELPRFVATVEQELGASRDVLTILGKLQASRRSRLCP